MKALLCASAIFLTLAGAALGSPTKKHPAAKPKPAVLVCPVTGETISSIKDAAGSSVYKGKRYYFCCPSCKPMFDANPAKYVKAAAAQKKPLPPMKSDKA